MVPTTGINHRFSTLYGNRNVIYMNNVAIRKSIVAQMTAEARDVSTPETVDAALPNKRGEFAHDLTREQEAAVKAVRLASHLCDHVQSQLKDAEKVEKDDSSPVTVADYGAQALTSWSLLRSLPDLEFKMIAEEDSDDLKAPEGAAMLRRITDLVNHTLSECEEDAPLLTPDDVIDLIDAGRSDGGPSGRYWVLDPIDGTRGFVSMRQYAVCLGLLVDGEIGLGVLGCPNLPQWSVSDVDCNEAGACDPYDEVGIGCCFAAHRGRGAFAGPLFNTEGLPTIPVHCNDLLAPEEVRFMESVEAKHSNHHLSAAVAEEIGLELPSLRIDSQAKYGALSRGDASIFMRFPPDTYREKIWDHVAGVAVLEEAGGVVTDALGNPLDFSQGRYLPYLNGGLIAATPSMHRAIIAALKKIREESS
jgi:3'(2'), 5'-bisphosphate nucleotidase/inositol polyphosphate 1-phosphatase